MLRPTLKAILASALAFAPAIATAQTSASAAPASVASVSAPESTDGSQLAGDSSFLIALALLAVVIGAAYLLSEGDNSNSP